MSSLINFRLYVKTKDGSKLTEELKNYISNDLTGELDNVVYPQVDYENTVCFGDSEYMIYFGGESRYDEDDVLRVVRESSEEHPELVYRLEVCDGNTDYGYWAYNMWNGKAEYLEGRVTYDEPKEVFY